MKNTLKFYFLNSTSYLRAPARSGQALVLILLVMAISLTLGVSVASRSITTLKQVSFSAQSAQALAFAEAGIEDALKCLDIGTCAIPSDPAAVDLTGDGTNDFDYRITALGGAVLDALPPLIRDETLELALNGYPSNTPIYISWVDTAKTAETVDPAGVELAAIYREAGVYKILRYAYDPVAQRRSENGFFNPSAGGFVINGVTYRYQTFVLVPFTPIALRIRPLYSTTASSFVFSAEPGNSLPTVGARIESTGFSASVLRKIEMIRINPSLSELFDFSIFSGSETIPLSK